MSARSTSRRLDGARTALRWAWRRTPRRWQRRACLLLPVLVALTVFGPIRGGIAALAAWQGWRAVRWVYSRTPEAGWAAAALGVYVGAALLLPGPAWATMSGTLLLFAGLLAHPASRRWLLTHRRLTRERRDWHYACEAAGLYEPEQRTHPQRGRGRLTKPERPEPLLHSAQRTATGLRLRLYLRSGWTATDVERAREGLATFYGARAAVLTPDPASAAWVTLDLAFRDPLAAGAIAWPGAPGSLWQPVPVGVDEQGQAVTLTLAEHNLLIAGEPGSGKSVAVSLLAAAAALDPSVRIWTLDGKGVDLADLEPLSARFAGADVRDAIATLEDARRWMTDAYRRLREQGQRKVRPGDPLGVVICDELAFYLGASERQREAFTDLLRDLVQRGRAAGLIVVAATQRPSADIVPTSLRDLFSYRLALRCTTAASSDMALGAWSAEGYDASRIPSAMRGVGFLLAEGERPERIRGYYLADDDLATILERAAASRGVVVAAPSGLAGGLPPGGGNGPIEDGGRVASGGWQGPGEAPGGVEDDSAAAVGGDVRAVQASPTPKHDDLMALLGEHLNGAPIRQADLARRVGRKPTDGSVRRALSRLEAEGRAVRTPAGWMRAPGADDSGSGGPVADSGT